MINVTGGNSSRIISMVVVAGPNCIFSMFVVLENESIRAKLVDNYWVDYLEW